MEDGKFVYGSLVFVKENDKSENELPHIVISYGPDTFDWFKVEPETVGQFTGMTDKNGTKIFEGDILNEPSASKDDIYQVFWDEDRFSFCVKNGYGEYYLDGICQSRCEVIGNIHDNKELLS